MYKELVISIIVIALIVVGNIITQNNTIKSVEEINTSLLTLRGELTNQDINKEKCTKYMEEVEKVWEKRYETMAYYIEHNELEKAKTELTKLKANIETKEYQTGVESLDSCIFILEHIKDKTALKIANIF